MIELKNKFVFSDPHFDHAKIIEVANRPFTDVAEMNRTLIYRYNEVVGKQDLCYWLGDIMYDASQEKVRKILSLMHGRKFLILGNHDRNHSICWWKDCGFDWVSKDPLYDAKNYIMLSHEPLPEFGNLPKIVNYHGHIHTNGYDFENHKHCINVCVEETNYRPIQLANPFIKKPREFER